MDQHKGLAVEHIKIRDDDFLIDSKVYNPLERFKEVHSIIISDSRFCHVPAVLCGEVEKFPGALEFLKDEADKKRIFPELHGWKHVDYGKMSHKEIVTDLTKCLTWFENKLNKLPRYFYTPWAAKNDIIVGAAKECGLEAVGGKENFLEPHKYLTGNNKLDWGCTVSIHWWKNVDIIRLKELIHDFRGLGN